MICTFHLNLPDYKLHTITLFMNADFARQPCTSDTTAAAVRAVTMAMQGHRCARLASRCGALGLPRPAANRQHGQRARGVSTCSPLLAGTGAERREPSEASMDGYCRSTGEPAWAATAACARPGALPENLCAGAAHAHTGPPARRVRARVWQAAGHCCLKNLQRRPRSCARTAGTLSAPVTSGSRSPKRTTWARTSSAGGCSPRVWACSGTSTWRSGPTWTSSAAPWLPWAAAPSPWSTSPRCGVRRTARTARPAGACRPPTASRSSTRSSTAATSARSAKSKG